MQKLTVGFYQTTEAFKSIIEHTAVMNEETGLLVAVTGPAHDPESERLARLFASAPELEVERRELIYKLDHVESVSREKSHRIDVLNGQKTALLTTCQEALEYIEAQSHDGGRMGDRAFEYLRELKTKLRAAIAAAGIEAPAVTDDDPDAGSWGEYQHIKAQHAARPEAAAGGGE
jgi:hypothetical protein